MADLDRTCESDVGTSESPESRQAHLRCWFLLGREGRFAIATASFLVETRKLDRQNERTLKELRMPTLVLLAEKDEIVNVPAVEAELRKVNGIDLRTIPDTWHSMEFAPSAGTLAQEIVSWVAASTSAKSCEVVLKCAARCVETTPAGML